jgi:hypothetical protein
MFRLITIVKRGTASDLAEEWIRYPTLDEARAGAKAVGDRAVRENRNQRAWRCMDT